MINYSYYTISSMKKNKNMPFSQENYAHTTYFIIF